MSSDWYDPDGNLMTDPGPWSDRKPGGVWEREHLVTEVEGGQVSTVWLSLDHSYGDDGPPLIFESLVSCDGPLDQTMDRYPTRETAHLGHEVLVEKVKAERAAWRALLNDVELKNAVLDVADSLNRHVDRYTDEHSIYGLGSRFEDLLRAWGVEFG